MNKPEFIIIHCSDSDRGTRADVDAWHRARGWSGIGYHWLIRNAHPGPPGLVEEGRPEASIGAHCIGFNARSIGVCLIGRGAYPEAQRAALRELVLGIMARHRIPAQNVLGHYETENGRSQGKTCPILDMRAFRAELRDA